MMTEPGASGAAGPVRISLVAAVARNGVIGRNGRLPWKLAADLALFRRLTLHKPVVMGRRTFESIGRPLDQRLNIVISRTARDWPPGVVAAQSFPEAMALAHREAGRTGADEVMVIGGEQVFRDALPFAGRLYITRIDRDYDGDTVFPAIDEADWIATSTEPLPRAAEDEPAAEIVVFDRKRGKQHA